MQPETLQKINYGVYIIASAKEGKFNGQIANAVMQITSDPAAIAISVNKQNLTHEYIESSKNFTVSILEKGTPMTFVGTFGFKSGKNIDKFKDVKIKTSKTKAPIVLDYTLGYLECEVVGQMDCGTHTIFLGKVIDAETLNSAEPMTYAYYHDVKRGKAPPTAPTYIKEG